MLLRNLDAVDKNAGNDLAAGHALDLRDAKRNQHDAEGNVEDQDVGFAEAAQRAQDAVAYNRGARAEGLALLHRTRDDRYFSPERVPA